MDRNPVNTFSQNGYLIQKAVLPASELQKILAEIKTRLHVCAMELDCSLDDYLVCVSRWADPSPIVFPFSSFIENTVKSYLETIFEEKVELKKINVISKTAFARGSVPTHQDIAYSPQNPYEFSTWIPLQDVSEIDGVMELLPQSHMGTIVPAVDFWTPDFVDSKCYDPEWQQNAISVPLQAGDFLIFESRLWHRSRESEKGKDRFAMVARWSRASYTPPKAIPPIQPQPFGMWTCGQVTHELLRNGLAKRFALEKTSLLECIEAWMEKTDNSIVYESLKHLKILHLASQKHGGGDAQGIVYPRLWKCLLNQL